MHEAEEIKRLESIFKSLIVHLFNSSEKRLTGRVNSVIILITRLDCWTISRLSSVA